MIAAMAQQRPLLALECEGQQLPDFLIGQEVLKVGRKKLRACGFSGAVC